MCGDGKESMRPIERDHKPPRSAEELRAYAEKLWREKHKTQ